MEANPYLRNKARRRYDPAGEQIRRRDQNAGSLLIITVGVLSLLVTVGCALLHVAIPLVGRGDRSYTAATSRWDCLEAASIEDLLAKDPEPFKSVADGKRPCFILKRALTNGPQLVQRLVERGVLEGDTLRYGPLASPFVDGFVDYYPGMSYLGYAISQVFRRPELWASLEKLKELMRQAWDGGIDPHAFTIDQLNAVLAPSGKKLKPAADPRGELQNGYIRIFREPKTTNAVGNVIHFDALDHAPLSNSTNSQVPVELRFAGSTTLSVNLIMQASEAYQFGHDVLMYNATPQDVHEKNPHLMWQCRTVGCWYHEEPFKEFAAQHKIASSRVSLGEGDICVFSSSRAHQVQEVIGETNRVTYNFFMAYFDGQQDVTMWA